MAATATGNETFNHQLNDRTIRVFISSTFRDMQEEREELVKHIFPNCAAFAKAAVLLGRWTFAGGVTDEAKAEGKVLPLCLAEIEHCRPYFIGLLGERYGWVPEEVPETLFETQPWLRQHLHQSVTALEILHGVLRNPKMDKHAFFYFRDPALCIFAPRLHGSGPRFARAVGESEGRYPQERPPFSEPFTSPKQLGEWVLRDLTAVVENLYPEQNIPDGLDRAAADQEAYAANRRTVLYWSKGVHRPT